MRAGNSAVVVDLPRCGPMLSPRVPNLVPNPGPRMERETPGQRPRPSYGHPQAPWRNRAGVLRAVPIGRRSHRSSPAAPKQIQGQPLVPTRIFQTASHIVTEIELAETAARGRRWLPSGDMVTTCSPSPPALLHRLGAKPDCLAAPARTLLARRRVLQSRRRSVCPSRPRSCLAAPTFER